MPGCDSSGPRGDGGGEVVAEPSLLFRQSRKWRENSADLLRYRFFTPQKRVLNFFKALHKNELYFDVPSGVNMLKGQGMMECFIFFIYSLIRVDSKAGDTAGHPANSVSTSPTKS